MLKNSFRQTSDHQSAGEKNNDQAVNSRILGGGALTKEQQVRSDDYNQPLEDTDGLLLIQDWAPGFFQICHKCLFYSFHRNRKGFFVYACFSDTRSRRRAGKSVMIPSTPKATSRAISAVSFTVQTNTSIANSWAAISVRSLTSVMPWYSQGNWKACPGGE